MSLTAINILIFGIGAAVCGIGLYVNEKSIHDSRSGSSGLAIDRKMKGETRPCPRLHTGSDSRSIEIYECRIRNAHLTPFDHNP